MSRPNSAGVFGQLGSQNSALTALDTAARARVAPTVREAFETVKPYLMVVFGNNPTSTPAQVLARPDVRAMLDKVIADAAAAISEQIHTSAAAAATLAHRAAGDQLSAVGTPLGGVPDPGDSAYLDAVLSRFASSATMARTGVVAKLREAATAVPVPASYHQGGTALNVPMQHAADKALAVSTAVDTATDDFTTRAQLAVSAAIQRAYSDAATDAYAAAADDHGVTMGKMWVANYAHGHLPCPVCAALSGQVVGLDAHFTVPTSVPYTPFGGGLSGPQAHPNCQCKLVPVQLSAPEPPAPTLVPPTPTPPPPLPPAAAALAERAIVAPALAALPRQVSATEIRALPAPTFATLLRALLAALVSIVRRRRS